MSDENFLRDLQDWKHGDPEVASRAYVRIWKLVKDPLYRRFRRYGASHEGTQDLLQSVSMRLWNGREKFEIAGRGALLALAFKIAHHLWIDEGRKGSRLTKEELDTEIPERDLPYLDELMILLEERERLYAFADQHWLGSLGDDSELNTALLAAQLFYLENAEAAKIMRLLSIKDSAKLDLWLVSPSILMRLAYRMLWMENDTLVAKVIRPQQPYLSNELDELASNAAAQKGIPPEGWTWDEVLFALWHIRNGLHAEQILSFKRCQIPKPELEGLFKSWSKLFPFVPNARKLSNALRRAGQIHLLKQRGLWKRIVFQYHCSNQLPYHHILERTVEAADVLGFEFGDGTLVGWIGNGRLFTELISKFGGEEL